MLLTIERVALLKSIDIFSETPDYVLASVARILEEVEVMPGEIFIHEGEPGDCLYLVIQGQARVFSGEGTIINLGRLMEQHDPTGNAITFGYDVASGKLITAAQGTRTLTYEYNGPSGYLSQVTDNLDRTAMTGYDNGDLVVVTNTLGLATTYEYSGSSHLLTKVTDPTGRVVEKTAYDNDGRAYPIRWEATRPVASPPGSTGTALPRV